MRMTFAGLVFALVAIVALSHWLLRDAMDNVAHDAALVNTAGRQRMRSQRLAKAVFCYSSVLAPASCLDEIVSTLSELAKGDADLAELIPSDARTQELSAALDDLRQSNQAYAALAAASLQAPLSPSELRIISAAEKRSLATAERVVALLTARAEARLGSLTREQSWLDASQVAAFLALGWFLLRPLRRRIQQAVELLRAHESALLASQNRFEALFNNAQQSFILLDDKDCIVAFNGAAQNIGRDAVETMKIGETIRSYVQPQNLAAFEKQLASARNGEVSINERKVVASDGTVFWYETSYAPVSGNQGLVWLSSLNISARKKAELSVRQNEKRFRDVVQHSSDIISVIALDGTIVYESPAMERILGHAAESLIGQNSFAHFHPDDHETVRTAFRSLDQVGKEVSVSYRVRHLDGHWVPMQSIGTRIESSEGEAQFLVNSRDITAQQREEQLLRDAKQMAEEATAAKASFLAHMSHEIRTPLNAVIGLTDLMLDTALDNEQRDHMETIRTSGTALLHIVNDVLDFSKLESDRFELENKPFTLRSYVEQAIAISSVAAKKKKIAIYFQAEQDVPLALVGDAARLRQVLLNLLSNAVKFTSEGQIAVTVRTDMYNMLRFSVTDTGMGLSPEVAARLFKPFTQANASIAGQFGGTGLGLAISKRLIDLMGGHMGVESEPGQGATFFFVIPINASAEFAPPSMKPRHVRQHLHQRVLLVDDNAINLKVGRKTLEKLGCTVICADGGRDALAVLETAAFDLVLLDLHMPEMDGAQTAWQIRARWGARAPKIVALTASVTPQEKQNCLEAGMLGFLTKPLQTAALEEVLDATPATATASDAEAFDEEQLQKVLELSEADDDVAGEVINAFIAAIPACLGTMSRALDARDSKPLRMAAHTLRGTSGVLGCKRVQSLAAALEDSAARDADEWTARKETLTRLEQALGTAKDMLQALQAKRSGSANKVA